MWQNFPALKVLNNPNPARKNPDAAGFDERISSVPAEEACDLEECGPAITQTRPALSYPGRHVYFAWEAPGEVVGPDQSYFTSTQAGAPAFVAWVSQLNVTYSPLTDFGNNTGYTTQPDLQVFGVGDPAINGTVSARVPQSPCSSLICAPSDLHRSHRYRPLRDPVQHFPHQPACRGWTCHLSGRISGFHSWHVSRSMYGMPSRIMRREEKSVDKASRDVAIHVRCGIFELIVPGYLSVNYTVRVCMLDGVWMVWNHIELYNTSLYSIGVENPWKCG